MTQFLQQLINGLSLGWYFNEWFIEWYDEPTYRELYECLRNSKLVYEPD
jgi:hypothetical protein